MKQVLKKYWSKTLNTMFSETHIVKKDAFKKTWNMFENIRHHSFRYMIQLLLIDFENKVNKLIK